MNIAMTVVWALAAIIFLAVAFLLIILEVLWYPIIFGMLSGVCTVMSLYCASFIGRKRIKK
jgi:uncharacterized RDD family membrane protein YckC